MFRATTTLITCSALAAIASPAVAGFTTIDAPDRNEATIEEIIEGTYGGDFVADGLDFNNGTINLERLDDNNDQIFVIPRFQAKARAVFAGYNQIFGYIPGTNGGDFNELFEVTGDELDVDGEIDFVELGSDPFRFARNGAGDLVTSLEGDNGGDQMVTYHVTGLNDGWDTLLVFFEDKTSGSDDYNDLVVEVKAANQFIPQPIPTPAAAAGLVLLGGLALRRRRLSDR